MKRSTAVIPSATSAFHLLSKPQLQEGGAGVGAGGDKGKKKGSPGDWFETDAPF
jgi:hypothetical protein